MLMFLSSYSLSKIIIIVVVVHVLVLRAGPIPRERVWLYAIHEFVQGSHIVTHMTTKMQ